MSVIWMLIHEKWKIVILNLVNVNEYAHFYKCYIVLQSKPEIIN